MTSQLIEICIQDLKPTRRFRLSFPLQPERYAKLYRNFFPYPVLVVNAENEIIFGADLIPWLKETNQENVAALRNESSEKEALFLAFNLKSKFTGCNLYEKLVFLEKILPLASKEEIYKKTDPDISINRSLEKNIDLLISQQFEGVLTAERVTLKVALALCKMEPGDRRVLLELFSKISFSSSHQLKILEMAQEIIFRDKCPLEKIFQKLNIQHLAELEKPQRIIIDTLFTFRNPIYNSSEKEWMETIKALDLPANMQVSHFPYFEKRELDLTIRLKNLEELKRISGLLKAEKKTKNSE